MEGPYTVHPKDLDMSMPTFTAPDFNSFCRLDVFGLTVTSQQVRRDRAVLERRSTSFPV
jgi:hypothetical protein